MKTMFLSDQAIILTHNQNEPQHQKSYRTCAPVKIQASLCIRTVWSESSLDTFCIAKAAKVFYADNEDCGQIAVRFESSLGAHVRRYVFSHAAKLLLEKSLRTFHSTAFSSPVKTTSYNLLIAFILGIRKWREPVQNWQRCLSLRWV